MAKELDLTADVSKWEKTAKEIKQDVFNQGWSKKAESFTQHYGTEELDASLLLAPIVGFIDAWNPKMKSTINKIKERLGVNGYILRYKPDKAPDGLSGDEGAFLAPNFWMVQNLDFTLMTSRKQLRCMNVCSRAVII